MRCVRRCGAVLFLVLLVNGARAGAQDSQPTHDESVWFRNVRQLTSVAQGLDRAGEAYFSPDSKHVSFQAYPKGKDEYQIYIMNLDGTGLKMISTGAGATTCSYWHPSGEKIIFASNHHDQRPAVAGEAVRPRETLAGGGHSGGRAGEAGEGPTSKLTEGAGHPGGHPGGASGGGHPGTQPAGAAATSQPTHGGGGPGGPSYAWKYYPGMDIFEYTLKTGALRRLTDTDGYDAECAYSPDGQAIVFSSFRDGPQEIYICDADGHDARRITHAGGHNGGPFFGPDGKHVCYRSDRVGNGNLQIFINNTAGTEERALTDNDTFHWCPFWHPSGEWLIYTHADFRGRPNFDLYLIRVDGSEQYRVTSDAGFDGLPVFSPDGRYLMWTSRRGGLESPQVFIAEFVGLYPDGRLRVKQPPEKR